MRCLMFVFSLLLPWQGLAQPAFWSHIDHPEGGRVMSIVADYADRLYAVAGGRIHRSIDSGATWVTMQGDSSLVAPTALTPGRKGLFGLVGTRLYRSAEGGESWSQVRSLAGVTGADEFISIAYDSSRGELFACTAAGILGSTDDGDSWRRLAATFLTGSIYANMGTPMLLAAGTVYRFDANNEYKRVELSTPDREKFVEDFMVTQQGDLFLRYTGHYYYYRSSDGGVTWTIIPQQVINSSGRIALGRRGDLFLVGQVVYRSTDGGSSWKGGWKLDENISISSPMFATTSDGSYYMASEKGIHRSLNNGVKWTLHQRGIAAMFFWSIAQRPDGVLIAICSEGGEFSQHHRLYQSVDDGKSWQQRESPMDWPTEIVASSDGTIYLKGATGIHATTVFLRSSDGGSSWSDLTANYPELGTYMTRTGNNGEVFLAHREGSVSVSTDRGSSWKTVKTSSQIALWTLAIDSAGRAFAGSSRGVFRSTDRGASWEAVGSSSVTAGGALVVDRSGILYAVGYPAINVSSDGGESWSVLADTSDIPREMHNLMIHPGGEFYVATTGGIWRSTDHGATWEEFNRGLYARSVVEMLTTQTGRMVLGTSHGGLYIGGGSGSSRVEMPGDRRILPVVLLPHPVASWLTLHLDLSRSGPVRISIIDIAGREIGIVRECRMEAGTHHLEWDASTIPSGVYLLHLYLDGQSSTQPFVKE